MRRKRLMLGLAVVQCLVLAASAAGAGTRAVDALSLHGVFTLSISGVSCPSGSAQGAVCYGVQGRATIRGLGRVTEQHTIMIVGSVDGPGTHCAIMSFSPAVFAVAGKGAIDSSMAVAAGCNGIPTGFTVTGGTGDFAGVSGSGTFVPSIVQAEHWADPDDSDPDTDDILGGAWRWDTWTGSLNAPAYSFDLTPPVLKGAVSKTVLAAKRARHVRVRFKVQASDAIDGRVPVTCKPRSGDLFPIGRTHVKCTASDSSANTATARFTITIKHRG